MAVDWEWVNSYSAVIEICTLFMLLFHIMTYIDAIILGIIEGMTEFLPVSSTGHMMLASWILGIGEYEFTKSFEIIIQLGAILAVVVVYWRSFFDLEIVKRLLVAFIPSAVIGLLLYSVVKTYLLASIPVVLWALGIGGIFIILYERYFIAKCNVISIKDTSYLQMVQIGLFQSLAMIPGVSRSAASIIGGTFCGLSRTVAVEFSFLLAVPTMFAATGFDLMKNYNLFTGESFSLLAIGFVVSFVVAYLSIAFLLNYVRKYNFTSFGIYRIIVAVLFAMIIL